MSSEHGWGGYGKEREQQARPVLRRAVFQEGCPARSLRCHTTACRDVPVLKPSGAPPSSDSNMKGHEYPDKGQWRSRRGRDRRATSARHHDRRPPRPLRQRRGTSRCAAAVLPHVPPAAKRPTPTRRSSSRGGHPAATRPGSESPLALQGLGRGDPNDERRGGCSRSRRRQDPRRGGGSTGRRRAVAGPRSAAATRPRGGRHPPAVAATGRRP